MPNYYWNLNELKELVQNIATLLGSPWKIDQDVDYSHCVKLNGPDGAKFTICATARDNRLVIRGDLPGGGRTHDLDNGRITVSAEKDAPTIAKDIQRRFLPGYLNALAEATRCVRDFEEREARRLSNLEKLAEIMGAEVRREAIYPPNFPGYGHLEMRSPDTVEILLRDVPFEVACKIAALLAG